MTIPDNERESIKKAWLLVEGFSEADLAARPEVLRACEHYCDKVMAERLAERQEPNP